MTPEKLAELEALADELEAQADAASREGEHQEASKLLRRVLVIRLAVGELRATPTLTKGNVARKVDREMRPGPRVDHPAMRAAEKAGMETLDDLAAALGVKKSFLSHVIAGRKKMPADRAAAFKRLTGKDW